MHLPPGASAADFAKAPESNQLKTVGSNGVVPVLGGPPKIGVGFLPPKSSHFKRVFHYKASILGYPYYFHHPFWGFSPICGDMHMAPTFGTSQWTKSRKGKMTEAGFCPS